MEKIDYERDTEIYCAIIAFVVSIFLVFGFLVIQIA